MKRFSLIFLGVLVTLVASCSKEVPHDPNEEPWVHDLSLPVPIEIGSSGFQFETKADMITADNLDTTTLRLFAIDKNLSDLSATPTDDKSVLFVNEKATFDKNGNKVVFDGGKTWYYPYASAHNYTFYAYHAGNTDEAPIIQKSSDGALYTQIDLNTNQSDILWAKATATPYDGVDGFNAKYMRKIKEGGNTELYPKLEFHHLTTALTFEFQTIQGDEAANQQLAGVKIESLKLTNLPNRVNLWIADNKVGREGKLTVPAQNASYSVEMADCADIQMATVGNVTTLGTMFVHVPSTIPTIEVEMSVSVALTSGGTENERQVIPVKLNLTSADEGGFQIGSAYSYTIVMKSLEEVIIRASVDDWNDGTEGSSSAIVDGTPTGGLIID